MSQAIQAATICMALMAWWPAACRIGQMHSSTHRQGAIYWHLAVACLALLAAGTAVVVRGDLTAFGLAGSLLAVMLATLHEWENGPPNWAQRQNFVHTESKRT
jgi:hypothetical protein